MPLGAGTVEALTQGRVRGRVSTRFFAGEEVQPHEPMWHRSGSPQQEVNHGDECGAISTRTFDDGVHGTVGSDEKCEAALIESRWPDGFVCPACSCTQSSSFRREGRLYYQCSSCRHQCSVTSGTIFEATKLPLTRWFLAMHLLTQSKNNVSALELKRHLGVCYKTAWLIKHKLMEVMRVREEGRQLDGRVEIDDAYLGGERTGGKVGRGSENKVPFIAAVQTTPDGKPQLMCLRQQPFTGNRIFKRHRTPQEWA